MRNRWKIAALITTVSLGLTLPAHPLGMRRILHPGRQDQILSCIKQNAWIAYFRDDDGSYAPVRDTSNTDHDKDWIGLRFTNYDGPRIRLGVLRVINKSAELEENGGTGKIEVPVAGIQEMLTQALYNTKRFDVIEQKRIQEVLGQQMRRDVVNPSPSVLMKLGKVLSAQYLVYGTVNEWNPERGNRGVGNDSFGAGKKDAEVAITFSLTDVTNGQILYTTTERARTGEWAFALKIPQGRGAQGSISQNTPVSYAIRACAAKAAFKIATFLRDRKWKGSIVDIKLPGKYYINAGSQQGMGMQTRLAVLSVQGIVKDNENGTVLGEDLIGVGSLEVMTVQPGFSIARILEGSKKIKIGDRVELATDPVPPPSIPACDKMDTTKSP